MMRGGFRGGTFARSSKRGQVVKRAIGSRVKLDGHTFDSFGEARRYEALKLRLVAGDIEWLRVHPRYPLEVNGVLIATYVADFEYRDRTRPRNAAGEFPKVIEDYKEWTVKRAARAAGVKRDGTPRKPREIKNPDWKLAEIKIRLLEALTGARVVIINAAGATS